jgi:hypothetical protein
MFGINDPAVYIAYLMMAGCIIFAVCYGIVKWNEKEEEDTP